MINISELAHSCTSKDTKGVSFKGQRWANTLVQLTCALWGNWLCWRYLSPILLDLGLSNLRSRRFIAKTIKGSDLYSDSEVKSQNWGIPIWQTVILEKASLCFMMSSFTGEINSLNWLYIYFSYKYFSSHQSWSLSASLLFCREIFPLSLCSLSARPILKERWTFFIFFWTSKSFFQEQEKIVLRTTFDQFFMYWKVKKKGKEKKVHT